MHTIRKLAAIGSPARNFAAHLSYVREKSHFDVAEEVMFAMSQNMPVVALESTIITHGMPFPDNIECAKAVEGVVREQGAVPATVAILDGRIKVGLNADELSKLGDVGTSRPIKTSRRDLAYVVSNKLNGGTTVSGSLLVADTVGIPIFATGGIGGVHRQGETTFDVSADLTELGRTSVACVSSGIKSILDIPKTLEYLETQGVFVATYGPTNDFPAFYCRKSGEKAPYSVATPTEAAKIIKVAKDCNLKSGMLFAVPVPENEAMEEEAMETAIREALKSAEAAQVKGKALTPFILAHLVKVTGGESLKTNVALVKNNARVAADIAVELANLLRGGNVSTGNGKETTKDLPKPFIIGGCNLDKCARVEEVELNLDGRLHNTKFSMIAGGVGRNICEALGNLGCHPTFLSAVGDDANGRFLRSTLPQESLSAVQILNHHDSAQCIIVLDGKGDSRILFGDMSAHKKITPELVGKYEKEISKSPLLILDGNLPVETIDSALLVAQKYAIPVFYEPTDPTVAATPFKTSNWNAIKYITPNLLELKVIAKSLGITLETQTNKPLPPVEQAALISRQLQPLIPNIIVTLGHHGLLIARKNAATDPLLLKEDTCQEVQIRHYPVVVMKDLVNVSGAGDCLASGMIFSMLRGHPEAVSVNIGFMAARASLGFSGTVPRVLVKEFEVFEEMAKFYYV